MDHENDAYHNKTDNGQRAIFHCPQSLYCFRGENLVLSDISQQLERLVERHEKRNGRHERIRHKGIEIHLKERGVLVDALDVRLPNHKSKSANADEHNDYPKKYY